MSATSAGRLQLLEIVMRRPPAVLAKTDSLSADICDRSDTGSEITDRNLYVRNR
jgi:hypothetical protein